MSDAKFTREPHLMAIAIAHRNTDAEMIQDEVFPRSPVNSTEFKYNTYPEAMMYDMPDTELSEEGRLNRVTFKATPATGRTKDRGIVVPLTKRDIDLAPKGTDPKGVATMLATNITQLRREKRCGTLAFDPNQFPDSNKKDIDGGSNKRFDEADTKPIGYIEEGIDACLVRPNYIAFGHEAWRIWKNLPEVRTTILGTAGGNVTRERAAEFFEVQSVLVGASRGNTAKPGKTPNLARLWGKAVLMFYSDKTAPLTGGVTFAFTAQYGTRIAGTKEVERGLEGGIDVMSGEAVEEVICAPRAGYLIYNAVG